MAAVVAKRQGGRIDHGGVRQSAVKVRKCLPTAPFLPAQGRPETRGIDRDENQITLPRAMLGSTFRDLFGGGEMDKSITPVIRRAGIGCVWRGSVPIGAMRHVVNYEIGHCGGTLEYFAALGNRSRHIPATE